MRHRFKVHWWVLLLPLFTLLLGVALLRVPWLRGAPRGIPCHAVFSSPPRVLEEPDGGYVLVLSLRPRRPEVDVILQELGPRGFGWLIRTLSPSGSVTARFGFGQLANPPVRVALESAKERRRGVAIRRAANEFGVGSWLRARGWIAPVVSVCWDAGARNVND